MNNNYQKFINRFLLLSCFLIIFDTLIGRCLAVLYHETKNPTIAKMNYSFFETKADILIFGSSRGEGHYIPQIIKDSTGLECFNTSIGGEGIFYSFGLLTNVLTRYKPKLIVYDLAPNVVFDPASIDKISILLPYYKLNREIQAVVALKGSFEKYKMISSIYPYNSLLFKIITGIRKKRNDFQLSNGYKPVYGTLNYFVNSQDDRYREPQNIDTIQIIYFKKFIELCHKAQIPVIVIVSPKYYKTSQFPRTITVFKKITCSYNQLFIDNFTVDGISENSKYFKDPIHLNNIGSELFSKRIASKLKQELSK